MICDRKDMLLYAVTDSRWLGGRTLAERVEEALEGGATFVQLREKGMERKVLIEEAKKIGGICRRYGVPFVIDDDVDVALASGADGVHVGQDDMDAAEARRLLGEDGILGVSARTVEQALKAQRDGASYIGSGSVFSTGTKTDAKKLDMDTLKGICEAVDIPVIAIGGVNRDNITELAGSGVCGVAVVSAIFASDDVKAAASELRELAEKMVK